MIEQLITPERETKFKDVAAKRQDNLTVVLENVNDPHNIGAVMRSCDAVGIAEVYVVYTGEHKNSIRQYIGNNSASGAKKWIKTHFFTDLDECFGAVRAKFPNIYGTKLDLSSVGLYDLDLTENVALVFGNEQKGISPEAAAFLTGNFIIPQYGMTMSLNISVACAVSLFEAARQRMVNGAYENTYGHNNPSHKANFDFYINQHFSYIEDKSE
jgi:tRNA (guanosine-2'-O-)-methyltransferase